MTPLAIARRYAAALFDVTAKAGTQAKARADVAAFADLIAGNEELRSALASPAVGAQKKRLVVESILALMPDMSGEVKRLLVMLAERGRLQSIAAIARAFDDRMMVQDRVVDATITTAVPLSADRQSALAAALGKAVGGDASKVRITAQVDPSIIGGVIARVGSVVYDGSVTRQLDKMKSRLIADA